MPTKLIKVTGSDAQIKAVVDFCKMRKIQVDLMVALVEVANLEIDEQKDETHYTGDPKGWRSCEKCGTGFRPGESDRDTCLKCLKDETHYTGYVPSMSEKKQSE